MKQLSADVEKVSVVWIGVTETENHHIIVIDSAEASQWILSLSRSWLENRILTGSQCSTPMSNVLIIQRYLYFVKEEIWWISPPMTQNDKCLQMWCTEKIHFLNGWISLHIVQVLFINPIFIVYLAKGQEDWTHTLICCLTSFHGICSTVMSRCKSLII